MNIACGNAKVILKTLRLIEAYRKITFNTEGTVLGEKIFEKYILC